MILAHLRAFWTEILAMLMLTITSTGTFSGAKSGVRAHAA